MEHYFYLAVKIAAAYYILYRVWIVLFRHKLFGLWDRLFVNKPKAGNEPVKPVAIETPPASGVNDAVMLRKRKDGEGYADIFLERLAPMPRKHTYISIEMYDELSDLLPVIARGVTVPNFLENLLRHHFDEHRDEINELYRNGTQKRF